MTVKDLEKLAKVCRKYGITEYTVDGVSLKFDTSVTHVREYEASASSPSTPETQPQYSEEDALYWSSTGVAE